MLSSTRGRPIADRLPLLLLGGFVLLALIGSWITPFDPLATDAARALSPPSARNWFGTDHVGRDLFSRTIAAARIDLGIAAAAVLLAAIPGTLLGAAAGFRGGWADALLGRVSEVMLAVPLFLLAMAVAAVMGPSMSSLILATALVNLPFYMRLSRTEAARRRSAPYVEAARIGGSGEGRILRLLLLPEILPVVAVQSSVNLGWAMMNAAGLSFLGLGIRPPTPEWGLMVAEGARFVASGAWWVAAFPGLALMLAILACNLSGDRLRGWLAVRGRE